MTDRIDLDDLADEPTDGDEQESGNPADWVWRDGTPPPVDDASESTPSADDSSTPEPTKDAVDDATQRADTTTSTDDSPSTRDERPIPHVPHPSKDKPVGIPVEGGGAGGGQSKESKPDQSGDSEADGRETVSGNTETATPTGPHGGDADDMTLAFSFDAIKQFDDPATVLADASQWSDWIGIVGNVDAHVINKFQRDHMLDVDFFNGTGTGPGERLAEIGPNSMFYAERMVLVGIQGQDEPVAEAADWEFVPVETAAEEADWSLGGP